MLLPQNEIAALHGVSTNAFRAWGLPSARREGRELLYDVGVCLYARIGQKLATAQGLNLTPLQELAAGYVSSTGAPVGASAKTFAHIAGRAGYDVYGALVALGSVSEMLGYKK
jgi:hypothetical protein